MTWLGLDVGCTTWRHEWWPEGALGTAWLAHGSHQDLAPQRPWVQRVTL